jgi:hypothetical protein
MLFDPASLAEGRMEVGDGVEMMGAGRVRGRAAMPS